MEGQAGPLGEEGMGGEVCVGVATAIMAAVTLVERVAEG